MAHCATLGLAALAVFTGMAQADSGIASKRGLDGFVAMERLPVPDDPFLRSGRLVWGDNCSGCHGGNKATGAPKITSTFAWTPRFEKGMRFWSITL